MEFFIIRWNVAGTFFFYDGISQEAEPRWTLSSRKCAWLEPEELKRHMTVILALTTLKEEELEVVKV